MSVVLLSFKFTLQFFIASDSKTFINNLALRLPLTAISWMICVNIAVKLRKGIKREPERKGDKKKKRPGGFDVQHSTSTLLIWKEIFFFL